MLFRLIACCLLCCAVNGQARELIIGFNERNVFRFKDAQSEQWQGVDIELIDAVFTHTPYTYKIVSMPWPRVLQSIDSGVVDMTLAAGKNATRSEYALFSSNVYRFSHYVLYARAEKLNKFKFIQSLSDIARSDVTIGALRSASYSDSYEIMMAMPAFKQKFAFIDDDQQLVSFALKGRVDGYIDAEIEGMYYLHGIANESVSPVVPVIRITSDADAKSFLMFSRETVSQSVVDEFDGALKRLHDGGEYKAIVEKYTRTVATKDKTLLLNPAQ